MLCWADPRTSFLLLWALLAAQSFARLGSLMQLYHGWVLWCVSHQPASSSRLSSLEDGSQEVLTEHRLVDTSERLVPLNIPGTLVRDAVEDDVLDSQGGAVQDVHVPRIMLELPLPRKYIPLHIVLWL